jgi:hypothetical protein
LSKEKLNAELIKEKLQIKVFDALEKIHSNEWANSTLGT